MALKLPPLSWSLLWFVGGETDPFSGDAAEAASVAATRLCGIGVDVLSLVCRVRRAGETLRAG